MTNRLLLLLALPLALAACAKSSTPAPARPAIAFTAPAHQAYPVLRARVASAAQSTPYDDGDLSTGQDDGKNISDACNNAKAACRGNLGDCPAARTQMGKCSCWKGGTYDGGYTCQVSCNCIPEQDPNS